MKKIINKNQAFGLIETIMASGIIVVVVGAMTLVSSIVLKSSRQTSEDLMANYLIHEVFESARQIRGTNYIDQDPETGWDNGLLLGYVKLIWEEVNDESGNVLFEKPEFELSSDLGEKLPKERGRGIEYNRKIKISKVSESNDKKKVEVVISWQGGKHRQSSIILTNYEQGF